MLLLCTWRYFSVSSRQLWDTQILFFKSLYKCAYVRYDTGLKAKPEDPDLVVLHQAKDTALI